MINTITQLLSESGMDIFYIGAIVIYLLFMTIVIVSTVIHQKDIQFYRVFMRKDKKPSKLSITWLILLPVIIWQSMTGDHEITTGLVEIVIAVFLAELAVQGIDIASMSFGRFSGAIGKEIIKESHTETEYEVDRPRRPKRSCPKAILDEDE